MLRLTGTQARRLPRCSPVPACAPRPAAAIASLGAFLPRRVTARPTGMRWYGQPAGGAREAALARTAATAAKAASLTADRMRNFVIIAHVDHGKSTLADRMMEVTGAISAGDDNEQVLDSLNVERERGITVKAATVSLMHNEHLLQLVDTPGHVDFSHEVARSLSACDGALLLIDATQGIQAQTIANFWLAFAADMTIIPVVNKIDLPTADVAAVEAEITETLELPLSDVCYVSAKTGEGVTELLDAIVERVPPPSGDPAAPLAALLVDSTYDVFRGVVSLVAVMQGSLARGDTLATASSGGKKEYEVGEVGVLMPHRTPVERLRAGHVGYIVTGIKSVADARVGDTLFHASAPVEPLVAGFSDAQSVVFAGIFPIDSTDVDALKEAVGVLTLNDASVSVATCLSPALGFGFRCGFLGLLHMDVFRQRLEEEHGAQIIVTSPTVPYRIDLLRDGETITCDNPAEFPPAGEIAAWHEPVVDATIIVPDAYLGATLSLCHEMRGEQQDLTYMGAARVILRFRLPLAEVITDFYDRLKSATAGFASFDYEDAGYQESHLAKLTFLVNGEAVDPLTMIVAGDNAAAIARKQVKRLRELIPRQQIEIRIQAQVNDKGIVARETISAYRKDVTAKLYGGDKTRRMKLQEKQKKGKKRMQKFGSVDLPKEAFTSMLKIGK